MTKDSPQKKIGILGGTFDPVTLGHLGLAKDMLEKINLDRVWFIPVWQSPHKPNQSAAEPYHRLNMLKEALAPCPQFEVSEIELNRQEVSYTIHTLAALQNQHPGIEWYLILGMDTFLDFESWKNVREILERVHLAIATRPGYLNNPAPNTLQALIDNLPFSYQIHGQANDEACTYLSRETGKTLVFCDIKPIDVSSSEIRERVKGGLSVKKMLPPEVEQYIMAHLLYQENPRP